MGGDSVQVFVDLRTHAKLKDKVGYAIDKQNVKKVIVLGVNEIKNSTLSVKTIDSGLENEIIGIHELHKLLN